MWKLTVKFVGKNHGNTDEYIDTFVSWEEARKQLDTYYLDYENNQYWRISSFLIEQG